MEQRENEIKIKRASFSIEDDYQELFKRICKRTRHGMTEELRVMLDARAVALGLKPIRPVDARAVWPDPLEIRRSESEFLRQMMTPVEIPVEEPA